MADNITVNTGTGATIATDQVGTSHYQIIKIAVGAADTATNLVFGQTAMAASIPVVIANNQSAVTVTGTSQVQLVSGTVSTVLAMPVLSATNVTIASITTGTVSVINTPVVTATISNNPLVCTAANVTVASITTGSMSIVNTPVVTATISNSPLVVRATSPAAPVTAYAVATTATNTILLTSGAHTIYVTDLLFSVDVPMNVTWNSATTAMGITYLATKGGFALGLKTPMLLHSAESLTFTPSASGSCAGFMCGYTVT